MLFVEVSGCYSENEYPVLRVFRANYPWHNLLLSKHAPPLPWIQLYVFLNIVPFVNLVADQNNSEIVAMTIP